MINKSTAIVGFILSFVAGMIFIWSLHRSGVGTTTAVTAEEGAAIGGVAKKPGAVKVEFYVMSQCPYGVKVVDAIKDVVDKMGPDMDFQMDFIGNVTPDGKLTSMHGEKEVKGNIVQLCAAKHAPGKYLDMVLCQNKNFREVDTNWEACAKQAKLPVPKIRSCYEGAEGQALLKASFEKAKKRGATGSPTIYINDQRYNGRRSTTAFQRAVCNALSGKKPAACAGLPEDVPVNVTVLNDKRCTSCDTRRLMGSIQKSVAKPVIKNLDYSDPEGKKLFEQLGGGMLPMAVFDASLAKDQEASQAIGRFLQPAKGGGGLKTMAMRASWNPKCADDGGCDLEECKNSLNCREEMPKTLEVFVMSQCPYGVKALNAMEKVLDHFDGELNFSVHFIATGTAAQGFKALHGQPEVDENIRELCAIEHFGQNYKYMDYVLCRNKNIRSEEWQSCTGDNGIATATIQTCFEGDEGKKLHEEDIKIGNALGISASPTWLANGRHKFSGIQPEAIIKNVCKHNAGMKGCDGSAGGGDEAEGAKAPAPTPKAPAPKPRPPAPKPRPPAPKPKAPAADPSMPYDI
ncbi:MAG: hypothetical protein JRI23_30710 [Deltaproteobacteria bacterium]|jgi:predicted DsbA family dithiol-disulfide isomerase|nr:hypothetical protein [Deltaproteobacteria bacterium]MBW2536566.1 hypothetical protein [Deltaproteobacteria bacterium]